MIQLVNDCVSQDPVGRTSMSDGHEIEIASQMFGALKPILTSSSYDHEYATTLDYSTPDTEIDGCEEDPDEPITDRKTTKKIQRYPTTKVSLLIT